MHEAESRRQRRRVIVVNYCSSVAYEMVVSTVHAAEHALEHHASNAPVANYTKTELDRIFGGYWFCVVGSLDLGVAATNRAPRNSYIDISVGASRIVIFRDINAEDFME